VNPGPLLSPLIRFQPVGAVIAEVLESRAFTDATSTSPDDVVVGRLIVTVVPQVEAVVTLAPDGRALSAGPAPVTVAPMTIAIARSRMWLRNRRTTGGMGRSPFVGASRRLFIGTPRGSRSNGSRLATGPDPIRQLASGSGLKAVLYTIGRPSPA